MNNFRYYLIINYIIVQICAILVASKFWVEEVILIESGHQPTTSLWLFGLVLIASVFVLILIKFKLSFLLYYFTEYVGLFILAFIILTVFINEYIALLISGAAVILRYKIKKFRKVSVVILAIGISALLGVSLGVIPVIVFLVLLSVYDILAVRKTKHMQVIAEDVYKKGGSQIFTFNTKNETFVLGSADIILPSILVVSAYFNYSIIEAFFASIFALLGLILATQKQEAPALPYASLGIVGFFIGYLIQTL
ncbi:MAG: presenilin family intramembrane aspartyl protease [Candidatus Methanofastidiosia archaeon]|jgi:presenilin-like A22 family membrane protease